MSPDREARGSKINVSSNIYTGILGLAFFVALATAGFVAFKCYTQYGTIFQLP